MTGVRRIRLSGSDEAPLRPLAAVVTLLTILLQSAPAHSASVTGAFVEKGAGSPLAAVEVVMRRAADSTVTAHAATGADGRFRLDSLPPDRYLLRASLLGHVPFVRGDVVLAPGAPVLELGTHALAVSPIAIKGAEVGTKRSTAILAPDRNIYLTKDMPSATTGSATDVLRGVPELDVDIDGHVSLRGNNSVNLQFNGRTAPLKGDALTTYLRQMPASRIERVEVIANPSAKFDPEGAAGIVNLVLEDNLGLGLSGSVGVSVGQRLSSPIARVAWQKGPVTLFGGVYGSYYRSLYQSRTDRRNLLTNPPSAFSWDTDGRSEGRSGTVDVSVDYAVDKRSTLYGTFSGGPGTNTFHSATRSIQSDSTQVVTSRSDWSSAGRFASTSTYLTLGFQNVVKQGRDERLVEFMQSLSDGGRHSDGLQQTLVPAGVGDQVTRRTGSSGYPVRSLQMDDTRPLGARATLELGYRGVDRRTTSGSDLRYYAGGLPVVTPLSAASDFAHHEVFHSGYVTLGSTFGRLRVQAGARGELARTTFDVRPSGHSYGHDYRSLFPSTNVSWDFGRGRTVRLTYSKRIERPSAYFLNPDVPTPDSLNRTVGNPYLGPRYTHSYSFDASWSGSRGTLRLSPFLSETIDNWDPVTHVNVSGAATTTCMNASSSRLMGISLTGSLRQQNRLGGWLNLGASRQHYDASNIGTQLRRDVTGWSANGNISLKASRRLDLQSYLGYSPASALPQGRRSASFLSNLGLRLKFGERTWANLTLNDPFTLSHSSSTTGDATYQQEVRSDNRMRSVAGSFTWTWGKPPEQKQRRQSAEQPQTDVSAPTR